MSVEEFDPKVQHRTLLFMAELENDRSLWDLEASQSTTLA